MQQDDFDTTILGTSFAGVVRRNRFPFPMPFGTEPLRHPQLDGENFRYRIGTPLGQLFVGHIPPWDIIRMPCNQDLARRRLEGSR